jgi:hypothetical protein
VRRSVDHNQIHGTDPIVDPLRRANFAADPMPF